MCDLRYVEDNTILSFSNRKLGIPLLNDGPKRLAALVGMSRAIETIFFDHEINAQTAVDMGLAFGPVKNGTGNLYSMRFIVADQPANKCISLNRKFFSFLIL